MKLALILSPALAALTAISMAAAQPTPAPVADFHEPGSFLVFTKFDWRSGVSTQLRLTNTHPSVDIGIKLNYICPGVLFGNQRCLVTDRALVLTPHETRIIDVKDHRPSCRRGFAVAFTHLLDPQGRFVEPAPYNTITGSWHVSASGRLESENAIAFQSPQAQAGLGSGNPLGFSIGGSIIFADFLAGPSELYTDFRAAKSGAGSSLTLLTLDILAGRQNPSASVYIDFWNAVETPFSTSHEFVCWDESSLSDIDANFSAEALGTDHGSMTIGALPNCPLPGGCDYFEEYDPMLLGAITERVGSATSTRNLSSNDVPKPTTYTTTITTAATPG